MWRMGGWRIGGQGGTFGQQIGQRRCIYIRAHVLRIITIGREQYLVVRLYSS